MIPVTLPTPTLSTADALIDPSAAPIVTVPAIPPLANPLALIVATELADEFHTTEFVRFCVLPSVYVPVAEYCWGLSTGIEADVGLMLSDTRAGGVTVTSVEFVIPPDAAAMVALPRAIPLASPPEEILATVGAFDDHTTDEVKFCVLPSL